MSRITFSAAAARAAMNVPRAEDESEEEEEPGEEIESAPPLKIGEEREINASGIRKKLLKTGRGWETPVFGDEVTVHFLGRLPDGTQFHSSRERGEPLTFKIGSGKMVPGLDHGLITMRRGEISLFTLPSTEVVPPGSALQYEVELISWFSVVDVCKDGGIVKKILERGNGGKPSDLDEVTVKYRVALTQGSVVAETSKEGVQFHINEGHLCPALPKILKTMEIGEKASATVQPQHAFGEKGRESENGFPSIPASMVLEIDLELVSFKSVSDIVGDMKLVKKVLKEGEGHRRPKDGESVSVRYTAKLEDGTIFEKFGHDGEEPLQFIIDEEQVILGLDHVAATMAKGEVSLVTVHPDYGYGGYEVMGKLSTIPASSTLTYEIEMVDFTQEKELWELNSHEKIEAAEKLKENGNSLFKLGKYQRASKKYEKAVEYIGDDETLSSDDQRLARSLRVSCWSNCGACSLKLKNFQGAIVSCSKALDVESCNVKALFRRAQAYLETYDLDLAEMDLKKAFEIDPQNRDIKAAQKLLRERQAEKKKSDTKIYANMFKQATKNMEAGTKRLKVDEEAEEGSLKADDVTEFSGTSSTDGMLVSPSGLTQRNKIG